MYARVEYIRVETEHWQHGDLGRGAKLVSSIGRLCYLHRQGVLSIRKQLKGHNALRIGAAM